MQNNNDPVAVHGVGSESNAGEPAEGSASGLGDVSGLSRREMLKITASVAIAAPLAIDGLVAAAHAAEPVTAGKAPLFFTPEEFAMVDELTELIIPTDDHSPGARAAQCAAFIDSQLAEAWEPERKEQWRQGLSLVNRLSQEMNGKPFMQSAASERIAVLTRMAQNERKPEKPEERFFAELKSRTARAYYTSKIGIHQELEYKGNTYQKEFSGFDAT